MSSERLAAEVGRRLRARGLRLATVESTAGGALARTLTEGPGCSAWFHCGLVAYADETKCQLLGVAPDTLARHGAVSAETVLALARGALERTGADLAVAETGIAGPDGARPGKPVGTVWLAWALRGHPPSSRCHHFAGDRATVRDRVVTAALEGLIDVLDRA